MRHEKAGIRAGQEVESEASMAITEYEQAGFTEELYRGAIVSSGTGCALHTQGSPFPS